MQAEIFELTPKQTEVLELVYRDKRNSEIAEMLKVKPKAVEKVLTRAYRRMGVKSRVGAVLGWAYMNARRSGA